eukprot:881221-Prymnesium_polylepis.1
MLGPAAGGFIYDTNALHTTDRAGDAERDAIVLEFHAHGKLEHFARNRVNNPCPSMESIVPGARLRNASGFPLYPQEVLVGLNLSVGRKRQEQGPVVSVGRKRSWPVNASNAVKAYAHPAAVGPISGVSGDAEVIAKHQDELEAAKKETAQVKEALARAETDRNARAIDIAKARAEAKSEVQGDIPTGAAGRGGPRHGNVWHTCGACQRSPARKVRLAPR